MECLVEAMARTLRRQWFFINRKLGKNIHFLEYFTEWERLSFLRYMETNYPETLEGQLRAFQNDRDAFLIEKRDTFKQVITEGK